MKILRYIGCLGLALLTCQCYAGWVRASNGYIPQGAWAVGYEEDGTPLYLCRVSYRGMHPGKIRRDFPGCNISFAGKEMTMRRYYVYVNRVSPLPGPTPSAPYFGSKQHPANQPEQ